MFVWQSKDRKLGSSNPRKLEDRISDFQSLLAPSSLLLLKRFFYAIAFLVIFYIDFHGNFGESRLNDWNCISLTEQKLNVWGNWPAKNMKENKKRPWGIRPRRCSPSPLGAKKIYLIRSLKMSPNGANFWRWWFTVPLTCLLPFLHTFSLQPSSCDNLNPL